MARRGTSQELNGLVKEFYEAPDRETITRTAAYIAQTRSMNLPNQDIREEVAREMLRRLAVHNIETLDAEIERAMKTLEEMSHGN